MRDDGQEGDRVAGDRTFTARFTTGQQITGQLPLYDHSLAWESFSVTMRDAAGTRLSSITGTTTAYLGVVDRIHAVTPRRVAPDIFATPHAANVILSEAVFVPPSFDHDYGFAAVRRFLDVYPRHFDLYTTFSGGLAPGAGDAYGCRASYYGRDVGIAQLNHHLAGDLAIRLLAYRWGVHLSRPDLNLTYPGTGLWSASDVIGRRTSGKFLKANGDSTYTVSSAPPAVAASNRFGDLELFLMGLLPAAEVKPHRFIRDPARTGSLRYGERVREDETMEVTAEQIRAVYEEFLPTYEPTKNFRAAFLVATTEPASVAEMSYVNQMAKYYGSGSQGAGAVTGMGYGTQHDAPSFAAATGNRATLTTRLPVLQQPKQRRFTNRGGRL